MGRKEKEVENKKSVEIKSLKSQCSRSPSTIRYSKQQHYKLLGTHSQFPEVVRCLVVATNEECHDWSCLLSTVVLVEGLHVAILLGSSHAVQISIITHCLQDRVAVILSAG